MSDDVIKLILSKLDRIDDKQDRFEDKQDRFEDKQNKMMEKMAASEALEREKEKRCDAHIEQSSDQDVRIVALENKNAIKEATDQNNHDWIARLIGIGSMLYMIFKELIQHWK